MTQQLHHGTAIAYQGEGIFFRGPSGSGKSDVALRCLEMGAVLVADDQVLVTCTSECVWLAAPPGLAGWLEVRGIGVLRMTVTPPVKLRVIFDLAVDGTPQRLPDRPHSEFAGRKIPTYELNAFEASAPAKIIATARALRDDGFMPEDFMVLDRED